MARKATQYQEFCYVMVDNDKTVPLEELTAEEKERMRSAMRERLSKSISEYCKNHPGTFAKLPGKVIE